jgi:hypothetical protein
VLRALIFNPLVIVMMALTGLGAARAFNLNPHLREMYIAAGVMLAASELAMLPLLLTRGANQLAVSQAALVATMVHLMSAAVAVFALTASKPFTYWLLAFYGATLISVSVACIKSVRSAPIATRQ